MTMMTDKVLERTISYLLCVYLNRKIKQAETIINRGGIPFMKVTGDLQRLHLSASVQETRNTYNEQGASTGTEPYEAFKGEFTIEGVKNETNLDLEELKHTLDTGRAMVSEFREKIGAPIINLFDKYLDRGMTMGEKFFDKKLTEEPPAPSQNEDQITILEAKMASLQEELRELKKPTPPAS